MLLPSEPDPPLPASTGSGPGRRRLDAVGLVADESSDAPMPARAITAAAAGSHRRARRQRQPGAPAMPVRAAILSQASGSSVAVAASSSSRRVTSASDVGVSLLIARPPFAVGPAPGGAAT